MSDRQAAVTHFRVFVRWSWDGGLGLGVPLNERWDACCATEEAIPDTIRSLCRRIADNYGFDCDRPTHPLHPFVTSITVEPIMEARDVPPETVDAVNRWLDEMVATKKDELNARRET